MIQGWHDNDYLILFTEQDEALSMGDHYGLTTLLPGYTLAGLKSWDDFILRDAKNQLLTVPTVPLDVQYIQPLNLQIDQSKLIADQRFTNKIRWFVKPLVFGGDAEAKENTTWLTIDQHVEAVKWWNKTYRDLKQKQ